MKFFIFVVLVSLMVILAGIYKFNYTDDDIYIKDDKGKLIHINEYEKNKKT